MDYSYQYDNNLAGPTSYPATPQYHTNQSQSQSGASQIGKRLRTGCHSCRIRKKRCDEGKPTCASCTRLGIECLGYGAKRPEWLKGKKDLERTAAELHVIAYSLPHSETNVCHTDHHRKDQISHGRGKRPRGSSSLNGTSEPEVKAEAEVSPIDHLDPQSQSRHSASTIYGTPESQPLELVHGGSSTYVSDYQPPGGTFDLYAPSATPYHAGTSLPLERDLDEMWRVLFGNENPFSIPTSLPPPPPESQGNLDNSPNRYLHHYLNVVLPMQFHHKSSHMSNLVAPLAMTHPEVLDAVSSLAALHMGARRTRQLCAPTDNDVIFAQATHRKTIERLRLIPLEEFPTEQVVVLAIFATSFQLFSGGTAKMWRETIAVCQRCLTIMMSRSESASEPNLKQYPELMPHLIWVDVVSSISKNTGSKLLNHYRKLLLHRPIEQENPDNEVLLERTMGCDSTTTLAFAEIVALSEWKAKAFEAGCLATKDLLERARPIEQLLEEREWRESHLQSQELQDRLYSDAFFYAAKILLASTIDGPYPSLPDIALSVQKMQETLRRLDETTQNFNLARGLVLPITLAGCHAGTSSEQAFFRDQFTRLSPEAAAFGNTHSALELMEEVWKRRGMGRRSDRVVWTEVMMDMGWEAGILLI